VLWNHLSFDPEMLRVECWWQGPWQAASSSSADLALNLEIKTIHTTGMPIEVLFFVSWAKVGTLVLKVRFWRHLEEWRVLKDCRRNGLHQLVQFNWCPIISIETWLHLWKYLGIYRAYFVWFYVTVNHLNTYASIITVQHENLIWSVWFTGDPSSWLCVSLQL
jgi:hypothetical protein